MAQDESLLLAYYGDDFTGSTDALEFLSRAGARAALFLAPPTPVQLARHPGLQAFGVAGLTRSLPPAAMEAELRPAFAALRALAPRHVHYKVCSTFDSAAMVGSIGRAIDVGAQVFGGRYVPLLVGAPALGRHCVFGNLFARMGIGSTGAIYRLDRHPSMSHHPVTPADESDLLLHLAKQTKKRCGLYDILKVSLSEGEGRIALDQIVADGAEIVLFDVLYAEQLARLGALIDGEAKRTKPVFSVGSSGIEMALGAFWGNANRLTATTSWPDPGPAAPLLVISGSCSPVTTGQIAWAQSNGFALVAGGDVSSYAGRAMGIVAVEMIAPLAPGAPLCRASAPGSPADGLEVNFKGGQVGAPDYFGAVARGKI